MSNRNILLSASGISEANAWDISKARYDAGLDAWDITKAELRFNASSGDTNTQGIHVTSDGTKMYLVGSGNDSVYQYALTQSWNTLSATLVNTASVSAQDINPFGVYLSPNGKKMYICGRSGVDINEYNLSTPFDVTSLSFVQNFSVSAQDSQPNDVTFKPDGTRMYVAASGNDAVYEYVLSTAFDISTASFVQSFSVASQEAVPNGITFRADGTKMYVVGTSGDDVNEYTLSTPWDISSASFVTTKLVSTQTGPSGIAFDPSGSTFLIVGDGADVVHNYLLGGFGIAAQEITPTGLHFKPDGTKMYVCGIASDAIHEYNLSTAWETSTASFVQSAAVLTNPESIFFKPDGTKLYVIGASFVVYEYSLSTAWDVSTLSLTTTKTITYANDGFSTGLYIAPDGLNLYTVGWDGDSSVRSIKQWIFSTPWDLSTLSATPTIDLTGIINDPEGLFFKPDGTKLYIIGGQPIVEFNLSTPWDISTMTLSTTFLLTGIGSNFTDLFWKDDGTIFWAINQGDDIILSYSIS